MKKYFSIIFLVLIFLAIMITSNQSVRVMKNIFRTEIIESAEEEDLLQTDKEQIVIVVDPGHGGRDPGKVGINNCLEKDINLSIALKLKSLLEQNDIKVIMTREEDIGLYSESDSNKKNADLNQRIKIIQDNKADMAVSIHQNSFGEEYVKGAQVFYHAKSEKGRKLAEIMQSQLIETINDGNHRKAKSNQNYYMLKKTECPFVIAECGYLSNAREAELLLQEDYQEKLAWAIHLAILQFINEGGLD